MWTAIDRDKNGELSLDELASYYGYSLDDLAEEEMSDETILELLEVRAMVARSEREGAPFAFALVPAWQRGSARPVAVPTPMAARAVPQMQTKLAELAMEKEKKLNPPKMPTSNEPSRRGSRLSSRGLGGSSFRGSEEVRKSAGVTLVKLASPINASAAAADPSVVFLQACEFSERRCTSPRPNRRAAVPTPSWPPATTRGQRRTPPGPSRGGCPAIRRGICTMGQKLR